jgi:hypothetical protein
MLVDLVKLCWETGTAPQMWAEMYIVAIPKKPSAKALDEHRGIALLQTTSKVLSHRDRAVAPTARTLWN